MARTKEVPNSVSIKSRSSGRSRKTLVLLKHPDEKVRNAEMLLLATKSAVKIIAVALIFDNSDFFADYSNYETISSIFENYGVAVSSSVVGKDAYEKSPTSAWTELTVLLLTVLHSFGDRGGAVVVSAEDGSGKDHGAIIETSVDTSEIDDDTHMISAVINGDNGGRYVAIDGCGMLY